ncbi:unnamed protein product, partial [Polarella glacialis]
LSPVAVVSSSEEEQSPGNGSSRDALPAVLPSPTTPTEPDSQALEVSPDESPAEEVGSGGPSSTVLEKLCITPQRRRPRWSAAALS